MPTCTSIGPTAQNSRERFNTSYAQNNDRTIPVRLQKNNYQVCVEPSSSTLNMMMLLAFAAERRRRQRARSYWSISLAHRALSSKAASRRSCCRLTGQTDGRTDTQP